MRTTFSAAQNIRERELLVSLKRQRKLADFIVLDRNVFRIPPRQIADVKVLLTVVGGQAVYGAPPFAQAD